MNWLAFGGVAAYALGRGGPDEKRIGAWQLFMAVNVGARSSLGFAFPIPLIDSIELVVCVGCALRSRSYWTIWASAALLLSVLTHLVHMLGDIGLWAYLSAEIVFCYVLTAALLYGTLTSRMGEAGGHARGLEPLQHIGA